MISERMQSAISFVESAKQPIDYGKIVTPGCRVLAFGENHLARTIMEELCKAMPKLSSLGFTHFGMEAFGTNIQEILDQYQPQRTPALREQLLDHTKEQFGWKPNEYMAVVDAAKSAGLRVLGLDIPKNERDLLVGDEETEKRNACMASIVQSRLDADSLHKVATLTGRAHAFHVPNPVMASLLVDKGSEATPVDLIDPAYVKTGFGREPAFYEEAILLSNARDEVFMLPVKDFEPEAYMSWIIYVSRLFKLDNFNKSIYSPYRLVIGRIKFP